MSIKIVQREFIGGPMDGHVHSMVESQQVYIYGDRRGHKNGEYMLNEDTGKMEHVTEFPIPPEQEINHG